MMHALCQHVDITGIPAVTQNNYNRFGVDEFVAVIIYKCIQGFSNTGAAVPARIFQAQQFQRFAKMFLLLIGELCVAAKC